MWKARCFWFVGLCVRMRDSGGCRKPDNETIVIFCKRLLSRLKAWGFGWSSVLCIKCCRWLAVETLTDCTVKRVRGVLYV